MTHLLIHTYSQLVTSQVKVEFQKKDQSLIKYLHKATKVSQDFKIFEINHIPKGENTRADLLAWLASSKTDGLNKTVIQETLETPSTKMEEVMILSEAHSWMAPIIRYLIQNELHEEER